MKSDHNYKGIILAGGSGTRLHPITKPISKQLLPVYDKPMIYYPLSVLMLAKIRDILFVCNKESINHYKKLFGDGNDLGINIDYKIQNKPEGIAQAITLGEEFIGKDNIALILGDNIFYGNGIKNYLQIATNNDQGATIFGYEVADPERFGVVEFDSDNNAISIEEKPKNPKSRFAVTGLYFYDNSVIEIAKNLKKSDRGEYEITDINKEFLKKSSLKVIQISKNDGWLDTGTHDSLLEASNKIKLTEEEQKSKIGCIEEIAFKNNWIESKILKLRSKEMSKTAYGKYLFNLAKKNESK